MKRGILLAMTLSCLAGSALGVAGTWWAMRSSLAPLASTPSLDAEKATSELDQVAASLDVNTIFERISGKQVKNEELAIVQWRYNNETKGGMAVWEGDPSSDERVVIQKVTRAIHDAFKADGEQEVIIIDDLSNTVFDHSHHQLWVACQYRLKSGPPYAWVEVWVTLPSQGNQYTASLLCGR